MNYKLLPKYLLLPFSELYGFVATMRNRLFDWGILKQEQFEADFNELYDDKWTLD